MFDLSKVSAVYSGRKGCACGCRGTYRYASFMAEVVENWQGKVSDRAVKTTVTRLENLLANPNNDVERVWFDEQGGEFFVVDMVHDYTYTVYFEDKPQS